MIVEKKNNFILITDIIRGRLVSQKYIGYSVTESKILFKKYIEEEVK